MSLLEMKKTDLVPMDRYRLSNEGLNKFKRTKIRMFAEDQTMEGFDILDCLYEHGALTIEEIEKYTGLRYDQVVHKMESFMPWGYIERLEDRRY
jgi:DNA-binding MarR family transcriptional regulator